MSFWAKESVIVLLSCLLRNGLECLLRLAEEGFINIVLFCLWANIQTLLTPFTSVPGNLRAGPTGQIITSLKTLPEVPLQSFLLLRHESP